MFSDAGKGHRAATPVPRRRRNARNNTTVGLAGDLQIQRGVRINASGQDTLDRHRHRSVQTRENAYASGTRATVLHHETP